MLPLWFLVFELHNVSRLWAPYSLVIVLATLGVLCIFVRQRMRDAEFSIVVANILIVLYILVVDMMRNDALPSVTGVIRLASPFVAMIAFALSLRSLTDLRNVALVFVAVVLMASGSIFVQVLTGPISWFAESSERAGLPRYASLLGSLTAFGVAAPFALICLARYARSSVVFWSGTSVLLVAAAMSLQKAALLGVAIAIPICAMLLPRKVSIRGVVVVSALLLIASFGVPSQLRDYGSVAWSLFTDADFETGDVSVSASLVDRLTSLPAEVLSYHGPSRLIFGVGMRGGAGVFGFDELPMAHNALVDWLAIGGVVLFSYGLWIIYELIAIVGVSHRLVKSEHESKRDAVFLSGLAILYLANLPFSSGVEFHPSTCWVPAALISFRYRLWKKSGPGWHDRSQLRVYKPIGDLTPSEVAILGGKGDAEAPEL